jgi:hypothetical protein
METSWTRRRFLRRAAAAFSAPMVFRSGGASAGPGAGPPSPIWKASMDEAGEFAVAQARLADDYPGLTLSRAEIDGEGVLRAEHGGMRVFWLFRGKGEVFLPKGYRTKEGDGRPLPDLYRPETIDPEFADALGRLRAGLASMAPGALPAVQAILGRWKQGAFVGDVAADLWNLEHVTRPWSDDEQVEAAIVSLFGTYRRQGFSTKQADSYEPLIAGDQVIACADEAIPVRGRFTCLSLEKAARTASHVSTARRLRYLLDTAGGCSFDFDPFRRLPLTWYMDRPGQRGDGVNFVNSHVVNIPTELSSTHFHPRRSPVGGLPQTEMYLVLDPAVYRLKTWGRRASILAFPDLRDLRRYEEHPLQPGDLVYIPPGVGHRGLDVFVNVLTVPGFKPHNEIYIDRDIRDRTAGRSPHNADTLGRKNYDRLEEFFD